MLARTGGVTLLVYARHDLQSHDDNRYRGSTHTNKNDPSRAVTDPSLSQSFYYRQSLLTKKLKTTVIGRSCVSENNCVFRRGELCL